MVVDEESLDPGAALRDWFSDAGSAAAHTAPEAERLRQWTRARFALGSTHEVSIAQLASTLPGMPPLETRVAFWSDEKRHHFNIFKPLDEVVEDDLPARWLKSTLVQSVPFGCECC